MKKILWLIGSMLVLSGCGQTGPLYLPAKPEASQKTTTNKSVTTHEKTQ